MSPIPTLSRRALAGLLVLGALGGCEELRRPNLGWSVPAGLLPPEQEPGRAAIAALTRDMQGANTGLRGQPVRVARAAALLEWLAVELTTNPRWAPVPAEAKAAIGQARDEMRGALGADPLAASPAMAAALAAAARALAAGNRGAAAGALGTNLFPRGGEAVLGRLADPGPLPQGEIAATALAEAVRSLDERSGWDTDFDTPVPADRGGRGPTPFGI
ncbi:hypothetical protein [Roseomonas indoligenes]|uniref:Uncharacterized protein n=1 Tax=Roseomonas indoligenes TaxID=2820811 RepID=A0A940S3P6_9PROT|nr:hypothetical protein [Pararoseomonas indoligenes]MBP0492461.1 hypothetical protein [Pararoseomonas indoligenes]